MKLKFKKGMLLGITTITLIGFSSCYDDDKSKYEDMKSLAYESHGEYDESIKIEPVKLNFNYPRSESKNNGFASTIQDDSITRNNIEQYLQDLLTHTKGYLQEYISKQGNYDHTTTSWFQEPWMGSNREPIIGAYKGNSNNAGTFEGIDHNQEGYVFVAYDKLAASVLGEAFDDSGNLNEKFTARFPDGSVIVKFAFSELNEDKWPAMKDAPKFKIMKKENGCSNFNKIIEVSLFQIDIVVRENKAKETGWVFSTLVYDKDLKKKDDKDFLSQFVFLGAMWGNNPNVDLETDKIYEHDNPKLTENWINNKAPKYSRETLGVGGRLSGPNDGAVALNVRSYEDVSNIKLSPIKQKLAVTSCMSCHMPAQYEFKDFLLPIDTSKDTDISYVWNYESEEFKKYFRNLKDEPFDSTQNSYDYNMALSFKSIREYQKYLDSKDKKSDKVNNKKAIQLMERADKFRVNH